MFSFNSFGRHSYGFSHFLREAQPGYVILYDPDVTCVRQLEMHRARTPGVALRVYFLFYDSSVEEQVWVRIGVCVVQWVRVGVVQCVCVCHSACVCAHLCGDEWVRFSVWGGSV